MSSNLLSYNANTYVDLIKKAFSLTKFLSRNSLEEIKMSLQDQLFSAIDESENSLNLTMKIIESQRKRAYLNSYVDDYTTYNNLLSSVDEDAISSLNPLVKKYKDGLKTFVSEVIEESGEEYDVSSKIIPDGLYNNAKSTGESDVNNMYIVSSSDMLEQFSSVITYRISMLSRSSEKIKSLSTSKDKLVKLSVKLGERIEKEAEMIDKLYSLIEIVEFAINIIDSGMNSDEYLISMIKDVRSEAGV